MILDEFLARERGNNWCPDGKKDGKLKKKKLTLTQELVRSKTLYLRKVLSTVHTIKMGGRKVG